jgi:hypothetical protein
LLAQAGPGMNREDELSQLLWEASLDHCMELGVLFAGEVADPTDALLAMAHQVRCMGGERSRSSGQGAAHTGPV